MRNGVFLDVFLYNKHAIRELRGEGNLLFMAKKKKGFAGIIILVILVLLGVGAFVYFKYIRTPSDLNAGMLAPEATYTVERGTVETTITAPGQLEAGGKAFQQLPDGLRVTSVAVKAGDTVTAGQALATLDKESVYAQLLYVRLALDKLDKKLGDDELSKRIDSPTEGRLKYQPVKIGDNVIDAMQEYGLLAILSVDGLMELTIQSDAALTIGERYVVKFEGSRGVWGSVVEAIDGGYVLTLSDERAPYHGKADVYVNDTIVGSGTLEIHMPVNVYGFAGVIEKIGYKINDSVPGGKIMFSVKNAPVEVAFQQKYIERQAVSDRLNRLIALWNDPTVYAEKDGVLAETTLTQGGLTGKVEKCDKNSDVFTYSVGGPILFAASVDELDINKVMLGQEVEVTFIAYEDEMVTGTVTRISAIGKKENSISSYRVEIMTDANDKLFEGMNGTATILAQRVENVLLVPAVAINEDADGAYVNVLAADGSKTPVQIVTGHSDGTNVEVLSGLSEGDVISYADTSMEDSLYDMANSTAIAVG